MKVEIYDYDELTRGLTFLKSYEEGNTSIISKLIDGFEKLKSNGKITVCVLDLIEDVKSNLTMKKIKSLQNVKYELRNYKERIIAKIEFLDSQRTGIFLKELKSRR